jgi:hypothetical protein
VQSGRRKGVTAWGEWCRGGVLFVVTAGVRLSSACDRSHTLVFGLVAGFRPANCKIGLVGSVLDHPPPTSSVGGQAPVVGWWWLAGKASDGVGGGVGPGREVIDVGWSVDVCFCSLRSIADGSGSSGHGDPPSRAPVARRTATLGLSVRVAGAPVPPEAVKNCNKENSGPRRRRSHSEAHSSTKARLCVGLLFCEALRAKFLCAEATRVARRDVEASIQTEHLL